MKTYLMINKRNIIYINTAGPSLHYSVKDNFGQRGFEFFNIKNRFNFQKLD